MTCAESQKNARYFCLVVKLIDSRPNESLYFRRRKQASNIELQLTGWNTSANVKFSIKWIHSPVRIIIGIQFQFESVFRCTIKTMFGVWTNMKRWRVFMIQQSRVGKTHCDGWNNPSHLLEKCSKKSEKFDYTILVSPTVNKRVIFSHKCEIDV